MKEKKEVGPSFSSPRSRPAWGRRVSVDTRVHTKPTEPVTVQLRLASVKPAVNSVLNSVHGGQVTNNRKEDSG